VSADPRLSLGPEEVARLAALARIRLEPDHLQRLAGQLDVILQSVATVSEVATDDVPPTSHPLPLTNVFRPDVPGPVLTPEQALAGAPAVENGRFRVPRILDDEP
jgi:aspartyl-tRNA(Asn)/glutamyl-tRNA(Gln) amidotransferase subunit C